MKSKILFVSILTLILITLVSSISFAKYKLDANLSMQVYIDKTPPTITIKSDDKNGTYNKTDLDNVIKNNCEIKVTTADNIKIKTNEYYYNSTKNDFNNISAKTFTSGTIFNEDGYYRISATDTSGNKTEIIFLIDKSAPEVKVEFFKKGEVTSSAKKILQVAGIKNNFLTEQEVTTENEQIEEISSNDYGISLASLSASITVYNETDLRNAINSQYENIIIGTSINLSNPLYINYNLTLSPASNENAIRYSEYNTFITVQNGGTLTLQSIVVDTRAFAAGHNLTSINVQSGGKVIFKENSIVDGGSGNTGMIINSGATAQIHSCHFAFANKGIIVKGNGSLSFYNTEGGRTSEFWSNATAISFEGFTGNCSFNQSNIKIRDNTSNGIVVESSTGTISMSNGLIYNNSSNGIVSKAGTFNISGGSIYSNGNGINFGAGKLNISGSSIYSNTNGIYLNPSYSGKMTISNVNIYSNSQNAIYHDQDGDGNCTIIGGSISGNIYLAKNDNYVNTNSSYPTFTVKPSTYFFRRKLVKTTSNAIANTEISKVTMIPSGEWYKYVDNEYIVVWKGCNIQINYVDYYGNILSSEKITGNLGESYTTSAKEISGYDVISIPSNANGTYTEKDITIEYKYDLKNIAKVTFEDLLSGVVSAKYWYNSNSQSFNGNGIDFSNGTIFENYGYYKVIVTNGVGLQKEITFQLNKNSLVR